MSRYFKKYYGKEYLFQIKKIRLDIAFKSFNKFIKKIYRIKLKKLSLNFSKMLKGLII
jgi:hypothetical protein